MLKGKRLLAWCSLCVTVIVSAPSAWSEELIFTYWNEALEPFAIRSNNKLVGGMVKDIGDELAERANLKPKYIELPTKRVAIMVTSGEAHVSCLTNPKWEEKPDNYHWSSVLFEGTDNYLIRLEDVNTLNSVADFEGKRIGTYNGYVYNQEIMSLFAEGKAESVPVGSLATGMRLVEMGRLDTVIDFGAIIEYEIKKQGLENKLAIATVDADVFGLHCSYSLKMPYDAEMLDNHLLDMKKEGFFEQLQARYR
ncbi:substrate-binding periplasmic protein [Alkalimarinus coralli]|uniref:substrate-binding periplasmic protein n=1 Tax=Alkalimarinus coralli TaxID=2935863 RepID=UPI00202B8587|nr:transporter substrate-binding domain-containing protein [Alkalimarinus coralli]